MTDPTSNSPNPYQPPPIKSDASRKPSLGQTLTLIALVLLTIPAAGIASLGTCFFVATAMEGGGASPDTMIFVCLGVGGIVGLATLFIGVRLVMRLSNKWYKPPESGK